MFNTVALSCLVSEKQRLIDRKSWIFYASPVFNASDRGDVGRSSALPRFILRTLY